ncbi:MAG: HEAT repeat domain-containing protein [Planctomycetota bacterium]|nr:HEAT repeat domain-containing protein [Planctomycetota bacterium]
MRVLRFLFRPPVLMSVLIAGWISSLVNAADPPTDPRVKGPVAKAVRLIKQEYSRQNAGYKTLAAYALAKAGEPVTSAEIIEAIAAIKQKTHDDGSYHPVDHHYAIYEAGTDLMFLADVHGEENWDAIEIIGNYIVKEQHGPGFWTYPGEKIGDTSQTQYAMLGLWAAARVGYDTPMDAWNRSARWLAATQLKDGGFTYKPGTSEGLDGGRSNPNMTNAGAGCLLIARLYLYPDKPAWGSKEKDESQPKKAFGVLEAAKPAAGGGTPAQQRAELDNVIPLSALDDSIRRGLGWIAGRSTSESSSAFRNYFYYTLERVAALANTEPFGSNKWFDESLKSLVSKQLPSGGWTERLSEPASAALAILFMTRSTDKILKEMVGSGLLTGGRGLPSDLTNADVSGGAIKEKRKIEGPLDELLTELSALNPDSIADAQAAIVEKVQVGNREELLGEMDRIRDLIAHPDPELRRTAVWALGRSGDLKDANLLISALSDNNVDVLTEAYNSLSYLSRKIDGVGMDPSPFAGLSEFPTQPEKDAAMVAWRKEALKRWGAWYLRIRPYAERNDIFELGLKNKR